MALFEPKSLARSDRNGWHCLNRVIQGNRKKPRVDSKRPPWSTRSPDQQILDDEILDKAGIKEDEVFHLDLDYPTEKNRIYLLIFKFFLEHQAEDIESDLWGIHVAAMSSDVADSIPKNQRGNWAKLTRDIIQLVQNLEDAMEVVKIKEIMES